MGVLEQRDDIGARLGPGRGEQRDFVARLGEAARKQANDLLDAAIGGCGTGIQGGASMAMRRSSRFTISLRLTRVA